MKRLLAILLALMFALGCIPFAAADEAPAFSGLVTAVYPNAVTVTNSYGSALTFILPANAAVPGIGSNVTVNYSGDISTQLTANKVTVNSASLQKKASGVIRGINGNSVLVECTGSVLLNLTVLDSTAIGGKAATLEVGQNIEFVYAEVIEFLSTANIAVSINITGVTKEVKVPDQKKEEELPVNKQLSGTVTALSGTKITIKTSKGKKWSFKINKHTYTYGKYDLEVGCKVTVTYDGYASEIPNAKKIKTTKAAPQPDPEPTTKKITGICEYFEGMAIGLRGKNFSADVAYAVHTGQGYRGPGTKVTVTYYTQNGENYATKIRWHADS